jgi:outer membrane protein assembly complex protein YaeT
MRYHLRLTIQLIILVAITILLHDRIEGQPVVRQVDVEGRRAVAEKVLLGLMQTRPGAVLDRAMLTSDIVTLLDWYRDQGYLTARIDSPELLFDADSAAVDVVITVQEGPLVRIGQMELEGLHHFDRRTLENLMELRPGKVLRKDLLEADLDRILMAYENEGFPYCQIRVSDLRLTREDRLNFKLLIQEGPLVRIAAIEPQGNTITRDNVIVREMGIAEGDLFDARAFQRARRRLQRLGFFREVGEIEVLPGDRPELVILRVPVEEGRTNRIDGVVGYQPGSETEEGYFTGLVDLSFRNLMGTGRRVEASWSRRDPLSSRLRFGYQEPWLLGLPITAGGFIQQINQDSSYAQTNLGIEATSFLGQYLVAGVMFESERVIPDSRGGQGLPKSRTYSAGLRLELDVRDDLLAPRQGGRYATTVRHRFKINRATETYQPAREDVQSTEFTADVEQYQQLFRHQVVALGIHLGEIRSDEEIVPLNEQFKMGGARTLRGYREEQFHGSRILWANLEYRYMLGRRSWVFLFLDGGHYFYRQKNPLTERLEEIGDEKVGYGFGLRVESRLGILGVDYGLGEGDGLTQGKVHFGLINEF